MKFDENFFDLFSQPVSFNVTTQEIKKKFKELQKKYHPDKFVNSTPHEHRIAIQFSAYLNTAYSVLINPIDRAEYLLKIKGISYDKDNITINDADFLMEQMDLRQSIDLAKKENDINSVEVLKKKIHSNFDFFSNNFSSLINKDIKSYTHCMEDELRDYLSKMIFYRNLLEDLK